MLVDIMTKALAKEKHANNATMRRMIGMANTTPSSFEDGRFRKEEKSWRLTSGSEE